MFNSEDLINKYLGFITANIDYSLSGARTNILRRGNKPYKFSFAVKDIYNQLQDFLNTFEYQKSVKLMFKERIGDCWEQALILSMMLKFTPHLDNEFNIYIASSSNVNHMEQHSFALLVKRNTDFHRLFDQMILTINGQELFNKEDKVLIADPWADKIFSPITPENHPFKNLDFANIKLFLQNIDKCFIDFQKEFPNLYIELFTHYLENLIRIPSQLKQVIQSKQFELALRRASVSDKFFPIVKALVDFQEILNININATGSAGSAWDIACKYNCIQVKSYLENYQNKSEVNELIATAASSL